MSKNIVYILGNGFDINQGLPTDYKHFYDYYVNKQSDQDVVMKLKGDISGNYENWSDLEKGLGSYTTKLNSFDELKSVAVDLQIELANYISKVNSMPYSVDAASVEKIKNQLIRPYQSLSKSEIEKFNAFVSSFNGVEKVVVLSFNYTNTIEKLLQLDDSKMIGSDYGHRVVFGGSVYFHNRIDGQNSIILGVDNINQIANESLRDEDSQLFLVKPYMNEVYGDLNDKECSINIGDACIIAIFGVSLGETDLTWWKRIGQAINTNPNVRLIFFQYDSDSYSATSAKILAERNFKKKLVGVMGITAPNEDKVFVKYHKGTDIFPKALMDDVKI